MPDIYLAGLAIDNSQCSFNRVRRYTNLTCPHIGRTPRDNTDNTMLAFDVHNAVDNIVEGTITTVAYNEVIILFGIVRVWCHPPGSAIWQALTLAILSLAGTALGLAISAFAPSEEVSVALVPIAIIPQIILGGTIAPLTDRLVI